MTPLNDFDDLPRELDPFENDWPWYTPPKAKADRETASHPIDLEDDCDEARPA